MADLPRLRDLRGRVARSRYTRPDIPRGVATPYAVIRSQMGHLIAWKREDELPAAYEQWVSRWGEDTVRETIEAQIVELEAGDDPPWGAWVQK